MEPMELRTFTNLWTVERRLYKLYDYTLPFPIPLRMLGIVVGSAAPWFLLLHLLHVPFHAPFHVVWLAPPAILGWFANKPVAEGKRLTELVQSHVRYWLQSKRYARLAPAPVKPVSVAARVQVWHAANAPMTPQTAVGDTTTAGQGHAPDGATYHPA